MMHKISSTSPSSQSAASSSFSNASSLSGDESDGAKNYLPAFLANRKPAHIGSIDLHFTKLPDGRCLYTYTVDWKENIKEAATMAQRQESDFAQMLKLDRLDQISAKSSSRPSLLRSPSSVAASVFVETNEPKYQQQKKQQKLCAAAPPSKTKTTPCCNKQLRRRCDGPCNRNLDIHDLQIIGLCEHVTCEQCLENAPRIEANFGGLGCPNVRCYLLDLASLCPDKKQRMETIRRAYALTSAPASSTTSTYTYSTTMSIETKKK
uniref:RING-type domain-containing protein n=1 Tax=Panagrolaimus sp. ES5 TaxID=591445 RepID=A0AC34F5V2_9BILA